jgi:hypothetical protein
VQTLSQLASPHMKSAPIIGSYCIELQVVEAALLVGQVEQVRMSRRPSCSSSMQIALLRSQGQGRLNYSLRMYLDPKEEFKTDFQRRLAPINATTYTSQTCTELTGQK